MVSDVWPQQSHVPVDSCHGVAVGRERGFMGRADLVAGYWIWELPPVEEAVAWVKRCPNPMPVPSEIEIGPI